MYCLYSFTKFPFRGQPYVMSQAQAIVGMGIKWQRVLVEMSRRGTKVAFFVDTGHRVDIKSFMMFHQLPDK